MRHWRLLSEKLRWLKNRDHEKTVGSVLTSPCITAMSSSLGHQTVVTGNTNKATMRIATLCCLIAGASAFGTLDHVSRLVGREVSGGRAAGGDWRKVVPALSLLRVSADVG